MGCHFLLQGIFLTQGLNPGLPHCRQMLLLSGPPGKPLNKRFQGRKGSQVERRRGRRWESRGKRGDLTDISCHLQIPRRYGTFPWASREGRAGTRPYQKSDQTRTRIRVLCQKKVISLQSSAQAEGPLTRFLCPGPGD